MRTAAGPLGRAGLELRTMPRSCPPTRVLAVQQQVLWRWSSAVQNPLQRRSGDLSSLQEPRSDKNTNNGHRTRGGGTAACHACHWPLRAGRRLFGFVRGL